MAAALAKAVLLLIVGATAEYRRPDAQGPRQSGRLRKQPSAAGHHHLSKSVQNAIFRTMGDSPDDWLAQIRKQLKLAWPSLPKVEGDLVDRHTLRHAVHGHFMQQHGLWIRGLAPQMGSGGSCAPEHGQCMWEPAAADALGRVLPRYKGEFSLDDAVAAVAALRLRALGADRELLEAAYLHHGAAVGARLDRKRLAQVLTTYTAHWLAGAEHPVQDLAAWDLGRIRSLVAGSLEAAEERRATAADGSSLERQAPWFSPAEAEELAGVVALTFSRLWEPQCQRMRAAVGELDGADTGRVGLAAFHRARHSGQWDFSESAEALREMGALEEGRGSKHPNVLIPNYLQAAPNCMVSTSEYRVCCMDECASLARKVEVAVHNASATPKQLLHLVREQGPEIWGLSPTKAAVAALNSLAASQGGRVALHGRAYAHWLHTAFPQACPLPRDAPTEPASGAAAAGAAERPVLLEGGAMPVAAETPQDPALANGRSAEGGAEEKDEEEKEEELQQVAQPVSSRGTQWQLYGEPAELGAPAWHSLSPVGAHSGRLHGGPAELGALAHLYGEPVELGAPAQAVAGCLAVVVAVAALTMVGALGVSKELPHAQLPADAKVDFFC